MAIASSKQPTPRQVRIAVALTVVVLLAKVLQQVVTAEARRADFGTLYTSGLMIREGKGPKLYDVEEQQRIQEKFLGRQGVLIVIHPPFEALLLAPLARLSYYGAYVAWGAINLSLWMLCAHLIRPYAPVPQQTFQYFILCFAFYPLWVALIQGQTSVLLLFLYCLVFLSLKRRQDFRAGAFLGLGLFKFQLVLPFALICLLRGKWRLIAGFVAAVLLLGALSILAVGPGGVVSYVQLLMDTIRHPANPAYASNKSADMPTLQGFFATVLTRWVAVNWINAGVASISAVLLLLTAWRWRREEEQGGDARLGLVFAAALAVSLLTGFHLLAHDLSPMLLALLLAIAVSPRSQPSGWRRLLIVSIVPLYLPPVFWVLFHWGRVCLLCPALVGFALAVFGLLGRPSLNAAHRTEKETAGTQSLV